MLSCAQRERWGQTLVPVALLGLQRAPLQPQSHHELWSRKRASCWGGEGTGWHAVLWGRAVGRGGRRLSQWARGTWSGRVGQLPGAEGRTAERPAPRGRGAGAWQAGAGVQGVPPGASEAGKSCVCLRETLQAVPGHGVSRGRDWGAASQTPVTLGRRLLAGLEGGARCPLPSAGRRSAGPPETAGQVSCCWGGAAAAAGGRAEGAAVGAGAAAGLSWGPAAPLSPSSRDSSAGV